MLYKVYKLKVFVLLVLRCKNTAIPYYIYSKSVPLSMKNVQIGLHPTYLQGSAKHCGGAAHNNVRVRAPTARNENEPSPSHISQECSYNRGFGRFTPNRQASKTVTEPSRSGGKDDEQGLLVHNGCSLATGGCLFVGKWYHFWKSRTTFQKVLPLFRRQALLAKQSLSGCEHLSSGCRQTSFKRALLITDLTYFN